MTIPIQAKPKTGNRGTIFKTVLLLATLLINFCKKSPTHTVTIWLNVPVGELNGVAFDKLRRAS